MRFSQPGIYHVYNRGINKQPIFFSHDDYLHFKSLCTSGTMQLSGIWAQYIYLSEIDFVKIGVIELKEENVAEIF